MQKGFARPGYFFLDTKVTIREKFLEAKYRERLTGNSILVKLLPELGQEVTATVEAPHLQLALEQSDPTGVPGSRVTLAAEVRLPPDVYVYAPGAQGHKPIKLEIDPVSQLEFKPAVYPPSKTLFLTVIKESVPLFDGTFRISKDVKVNSGAEFWGSLGKEGKVFPDHGKAGVSSLRYNHLLYANVGPGQMATAGFSYPEDFSRVLIDRDDSARHDHFGGDVRRNRGQERHDRLATLFSGDGVSNLSERKDSARRLHV